MEHGVGTPRAGSAPGRALILADLDTARAVSESYFAAESRRDIQAVLAHFSEDAVIVHPDGRRSEGLAAIQDFYTAVLERLQSVEVRLVDLVGDAERAGVEWEAGVVDAGGERHTLRGVNLVTVCAGRFTTLHAYFGEAVYQPSGHCG